VEVKDIRPSEACRQLWCPASCSVR